MKLYQIYESISDKPIFMGYHCSKYIIKNFKGDITNHYLDYIPQILDAIDFSDKKDLYDYFKEYNRKLIDLDFDYQVNIYDLPEEHDKYYKEIMEEILIEINKKYGWIFVFEKHPLNEYGEYCYRVYFNDMPSHIYDKNELLADVYLYKKNNPPILEIEE